MLQNSKVFFMAHLYEKHYVKNIMFLTLCKDKTSESLHSQNKHAFLKGRYLPFTLVLSHCIANSMGSESC